MAAFFLVCRFGKNASVHFDLCFLFKKFKLAANRVLQREVCAVITFFCVTVLKHVLCYPKREGALLLMLVHIVTLDIALDTVKLTNKGHLQDNVKMAFVDRWPLFGGQCAGDLNALGKLLNINIQFSILRQKASFRYGCPAFKICIEVDSCTSISKFRS